MPTLLTEVGVHAGQRFPLRPGAAIIIGRGSEAQGTEDFLALNDGKASRRHARVQAATDGKTSVEDLGSSNGTYVNDVRIDGAHLLQDGDRLQIGDTVLGFTKTGAPQRTEEKER
jgi:pSer/pThr/pTyr-binding forkhead associated (FHA) protein